MKHTLLYVDDEPINLEIFVGCFERKYDIITASSAKLGLDILEKNPKISVVISDLKMPEINGLEFIKIAKEKFDKTAYFILTGYEVNDEISNALLDGLICKSFTKPFDFKEFDMAISDTLKKIGLYS